MSAFVLYLEDDSQNGGLEEALVRAGVDVRTCRSVGMNGASDSEQLVFAAEKGWVLYTSNVKDFEVLHRELIESGRSHAGVLYHPRQRFSIGEQARRILRIWEALSAEEMVNRVESISQWGEERG